MSFFENLAIWIIKSTLEEKWHLGQLPKLSNFFCLCGVSSRLSWHWSMVIMSYFFALLLLVRRRLLLRVQEVVLSRAGQCPRISVNVSRQLDEDTQRCEGGQLSLFLLLLRFIRPLQNSFSLCCSWPGLSRVGFAWDLKQFRIGCTSSDWLPPWRLEVYAVYWAQAALNVSMSEQVTTSVKN